MKHVVDLCVTVFDDVAALSPPDCGHVAHYEGIEEVLLLKMLVFGTSVCRRHCSMTEM